MSDALALKLRRKSYGILIKQLVFNVQYLIHFTYVFLFPLRSQYVLFECVSIYRCQEYINLSAHVGTLWYPKAIQVQPTNSLATLSTKYTCTLRRSLQTTEAGAREASLSLILRKGILCITLCLFFFQKVVNSKPATDNKPAFTNYLNSNRCFDVDLPSGRRLVGPTSFFNPSGATSNHRQLSSTIQL